AGLPPPAPAVPTALPAPAPALPAPAPAVPPTFPAAPLIWPPAGRSFDRPRRHDDTRPGTAASATANPRPRTRRTIATGLSPPPGLAITGRADRWYDPRHEWSYDGRRW